jgi:hypothetical protein
MSDRNVETVYSEDVSSGMGHVRYFVNGQPLSHEADNLDDAGEWREISHDEFFAKPRELLCKRCAPEVPHG